MAEVPTVTRLIDLRVSGFIVVEGWVYKMCQAPGEGGKTAN